MNQLDVEIANASFASCVFDAENDGNNGADLDGDGDDGGDDGGGDGSDDGGDDGGDGGDDDGGDGGDDGDDDKDGGKYDCKDDDDNCDKSGDNDGDNNERHDGGDDAQEETGGSARRARRRSRWSAEWLVAAPSWICGVLLLGLAVAVSGVIRYLPPVSRNHPVILTHSPLTSPPFPSLPSNPVTHPPHFFTYTHYPPRASRYWLCHAFILVI